MPFSSNSDLPETVRSRYSDNCQSVWRHTFNSVLEDYEDEHRAYASATGQANKCQEKKSMTEPKFKIFAPLLKTSVGGDGKKRLHGIASSTIKDRHGDRMNLSALSDMERSANRNLTIFLNHSYNVPEDVAGYVERAQIQQAHQDGEIHDLTLDIVVNETNQRAVDAWTAIQNGTQLGLSIGAMIPDGGATRDRKTGAYSIDHVELLETSLVGVPANPRSWVEYAVKSLNALEGPIEAELGEWVAIRGFGPLEAEPIAITGVTETTTETILTTTVEKTIETEPAPEEPEEETPSEDDPEVTDEPVTTNSAYDTTTNATVNIETPFANITVDTGNRGGGKSAEPAGEASQEALLSAPEPEDQDVEDLGPYAGIIPVRNDLADPDVKAALELLEPSVIATLRNSTDILVAVTRELTETKSALKERNDEYAALEEATKAVISKTGQILEQLSNTPAGRRAVVREASTEFASLEAVYSEDFLHILRRS